MNDDGGHNIDGGALARAPLIEIENLIGRTLPGSNLRHDVKKVIGTLAGQLIAGTVPDGMTAADAFRRGRDLLALLHGHTV